LVEDVSEDADADGEQEDEVISENSDDEKQEGEDENEEVEVIENASEEDNLDEELEDDGNNEENGFEVLGKASDEIQVEKVSDSTSDGLHPNVIPPKPDDYVDVPPTWPNLLDAVIAVPTLAPVVPPPTPEAPPPPPPTVEAFYPPSSATITDLAEQEITNWMSGGPKVSLESEEDAETGANDEVLDEVDDFDQGGNVVPETEDEAEEIDEELPESIDDDEKTGSNDEALDTQEDDFEQEPSEMDIVVPETEEEEEEINEEIEEWEEEHGKDTSTDSPSDPATDGSTSAPTSTSTLSSTIEEAVAVADESGLAPPDEMDVPTQEEEEEVIEEEIAEFKNDVDEMEEEWNEDHPNTPPPTDMKTEVPRDFLTPTTSMDNEPMHDMSMGKHTIDCDAYKPKSVSYRLCQYHIPIATDTTDCLVYDPQSVSALLCQNNIPPVTASIAAVALPLLIILCCCLCCCRNWCCGKSKKDNQRGEYRAVGSDRSYDNAFSDELSDDDDDDVEDESWGKSNGRSMLEMKHMGRRKGDGFLSLQEMNG